MLPPGHPDPKWMRKAIRVAKESRERGDYAFGAVLVRDGKSLLPQATRSSRTATRPGMQSSTALGRLRYGRGTGT